MLCGHHGADADADVDGEECIERDLRPGWRIEGVGGVHTMLLPAFQAQAYPKLLCLATIGRVYAGEEVSKAFFF